MRRVEFPFVTGQQEGVDPKVLPAGTLAAARNVMVRKDGSVVRRRALEAVPMGLPVGTIPGSPRELCLPDKVLYEMEDGIGTGVVRLVRHSVVGAMTDGAAIVGAVTPGASPGEPVHDELSTPTYGYSPGSPFVGVRKVSVGPTGTGGCPQTAVTWSGAIATLSVQSDVYADGTTQAAQYLLELRDPDTLEVFQSWLMEPGEGVSYLSTARLVASKTRPLVAVVFCILKDSGAQGETLVKAYSAEAPYGEHAAIRVTTPTAGNRCDHVYADVTPEDIVVVAHDELDPLVAASQLVKVASMNWQYVLGESGAETAAVTLGDGTPNLLPKGIFGGNGDEFVVIYENDVEDIFEARLASTMALLAQKTHAVGSYELVREGATWFAEDGVWNITLGLITQLPYGEPDRTSEECITQSLLWNVGTNTLATERSFYGAIPVSAPLVDGSRWLAVEVTTGTGIDNWKPNYASGAQLIELESGLVVGQLTDAAGGMNIWDGATFIRKLEDDYFVSAGFNVQALGGRGILLYSFQRGTGPAIPTRTGEALLAGASLSLIHGTDVGFAGFTAPPEIKVTAEAVESGGGFPDGYYLFSAVLEVIDSNGRLWRSAPASVQTVIAGGGDFNINSIDIIATCGKGAPSARDVFVAFYRSDVTLASDPPVTQAGPGGVITVGGSFGVLGRYQLIITTPGSAPNGTAEFMLLRDGHLVTGGETVPDAGDSFEFEIPGSGAAVITFENGNYHHNTNYTWDNRLPSSTVLYRIGGTRIAQGAASAEFQVLVDVPGFPYQELQDQPTLYTGGGVLGNDAPPAADFLCAALGRIWAAGLPDRSRIQASKLLVPEFGVEWSNFDSFSLTFPDEVVGIASVDETVLVFTTRGVHLVSGGGPDNRGFGNFHSSQRLPGTCGCVSARSIVVSEMGVFYQTARGIELVGRGFSGVNWIGQGVRDQVDRLPFCWGACSLPDGTVRFLMGGGAETGNSALLVWDQRSAGWYVYTYGEDEIDGGRAGLGETRGRMTLCDWSSGEVMREGDGEFFSTEPAYIETGWLRPAGINADHVGRRLCLLGQFLGPTGAAEVDIALAFDDRPYGARQPATIRVEAGTGREQYRPGDPIELQVTLPVLHFSSVRAKVTWRRVDGAAESVALSGLTVFLEPNPEGQRVGRKSKR